MSVTEQSILRFELLMDAGNGAQKAGDIIVKTFAKSGRFVFIEPMIPAEISPPKREPYSMSGVVIRLSDTSLHNIGSDTDFMVVEHEVLLKRRLQDGEYNPNCVVFLDMGEQARHPDTYAEAIQMAEDAGLTVVPFELSDDAKALVKDLRGMGTNIYYLGVLAGIFNLVGTVMETTIRSTFKRLKPEILEKNIKLFHLGADVGVTLARHYNVPETTELGDEDLVLLDGNTAMALGAIDSGIKLYTGYPITPASTILHTLAIEFGKYGGIVHQSEDEISAVGSVIGSYFVGVPSVTATSGPGLSLMQEFIGLSMGAEVPCIIIDVQRGGPSTGLPTRTEQSDLHAAMFGSHGDNTKIVLSASGVEDCFYALHVARYLTEKLKVPVIIMSDYSTSVSYKILPKMDLIQLENVDDIPDSILARFGLTRLPEIEMVSPNQSIPGEPGGMRRISGLNTDENDQVMNTSESSIRSHTIRNEKIHTVARNLVAPDVVGSESGDVLVIGWGSAIGSIQEAVKTCCAEGLKVSGLGLKIVSPLPRNIKEIMSRFKHVVTAEVAHGDAHKPAPLAYVLRAETLIDVQSIHAQANGLTLKPKELCQKIRALAKEGR